MFKFYDEFKSDVKRYGKCNILLHHFRFLFWLRLAQNAHFAPLLLLSRLRLKLFSECYGLEIHPSCEIGKGFYLGHPFNITINPKVVIGSNVNIHKGVTIGQENRGARKGVPTIGDKVWIGVNTTIVGKIVIGNNVLIAPNTYINTDIPSNSIVFGNPCIIKYKINATEGYINNIVD